MVFAGGTLRGEPWSDFKCSQRADVANCCTYHGLNFDRTVLLLPIHQAFARALIVPSIPLNCLRLHMIDGRWKHSPEHTHIAGIELCVETLVNLDALRITKYYEDIYTGRYCNVRRPIIYINTFVLYR
jgi:hypothetical protein